MNRIAQSDGDYVMRPCHEVAREKMNQNNMQAEDGQYLPSMLILTGASGAGKTETALQLMKKGGAWGPNALRLPICCESNDTILCDITTINTKYGLQLPFLEEQPIDVARILGDLFAVLNEQYPNHIKYLLFIDAERSTDLIKHINYRICEPVTAQNYENWKVIVTTTDNDQANWLQGCDRVKEQDFTAITAFEEEQTWQFFKNELRDNIIDEGQLATIHCQLGGYPGALASLKKNIKANKLNTTKDYLDEIFKLLQRRDSRVPINSFFKESFKLLVKSLENDELGLSLIKMISLLDEKNITADIVIALAEVAIDRQHGIRPVELGNEVINQMTQRSLCVVMDYNGCQRIVSLHKLVRQGASLIFQEHPAEEQISTIRKCLVALTRIIPKDGRMHLSHIIYSCIYNHASSLRKEVKKVEGLVRRDAPEALLLYSSLLSSMAYLLLAQRGPLGEATELLDEALNVYFGLFNEDNQLEMGQNEKLEHLIVMLEEGRIERMDQHRYAEIVENLSLFCRLADKDPNCVIQSEQLEDGHIRPDCLEELRVQGKIIEVEEQKKIYLIEILLENLSVRVRSHHFSDKVDVGKALNYSKYALSLCDHVRQTHQKFLMAEVIIRRSVLEMKLKDGNGNHSITDIQDEFDALAEVGRDDNRRYGYEYGVRRTDFSKDDYHRLLCKEGRAACYGKLYMKAREQGLDQDAETYFMQGEELFEDLTNDRNSENKLTVSKTFGRYAAFLADCGKNDEAVRVQLDAMIYLREHLKQHLKQHSPDGPAHPEQNKCGKFTDLYVKLEKFYGAWQSDNPNRQTMLVTDGKDATRNEYLHNFKQHYIKDYPQAQADAEGRFPVMEDLLPPKYEGNDDSDDQGEVMPVSPQNQDT